MIPTRYISKLPKSLSWPVRANAISTYLAGLPHIADFTLTFWESPVYPKAAFQRTLRETLPYKIFRAEYTPARNPGYSGSNDMVERGWYEAKWTMSVYPVLSEYRCTAGSSLLDNGLPKIADWLRATCQTGWELRKHRIDLVFAPAEGTLESQCTEGV